MVEYYVESPTGIKFVVILLHLKKFDCYKDNLFFRCWEKVEDFEKELDKRLFRILNKRIKEDV